MNLDEIFGSHISDTALISSGAIFETLKQVLEESELLSTFALYKAASSYPFNEAQLLPFLKTKKHIVVVEEKRGFLENELRALVMKYNLQLEISGKEFRHGESFVEGFPAYGGLNYELIYQKLNILLNMKEEVVCLSAAATPTKLDLVVPKRLPTFCPGCPHRETLSIMKDVRSTLSEKNINLISHGDVGCYSLSFLEPFKEMHDLSAMGQGGALGAGTDLFTTNPSVVLMGDSTFFHSGMTSISNSVQMGHNITYILLDNDNTAMTGHQMTPVSGLSVEGDKRPRQNMLDVAKSLMVTEAIEINPSDRYFYKNLLLDYVQKPGVKIIVSNKECGLTFHGRKKRDERKLFATGETEAVREFYQINTDACEDCRACVEMTGCPGLSQTNDAYGTKVMIDPQICVSDSYCTRIKACPSFELVKVHNYHPTKYKAASKAFERKDLPLPAVSKNLEVIAGGKDFRSVVIGVGGSGVTTISRVLAEASETMSGRSDLAFKFVDQKGLAQRNGSVSSHLSIYNKNKSHGPLVPVGTADLVLSPDLLEGSRAVEFLSSSGLLIADEDYQVPLSILLDRGIDQDIMTPEKLQKELKTKLGERLILAPMKRISFERFGRPVYASAMVLGIAFQKGRIPFELSDMEKALRESVPKSEFQTNWEAFALGREWVISLQAPAIAVKHPERLEQSVGLAAYPWQRSDRMINLWKAHTETLRLHFPEVSTEHLARYVHDLIVFDQGKNFASFFEDALVIKAKYSSDKEIALRALARTYFIKDEVFVSHIMISPVKTETDRENYELLGTGFEIVHINRPAFDVGGKKIEFDFSPKPWMLKIMRHFRILRIILPDWHKKEKEISTKIRNEILAGASSRRLRELDSVKGYREVRYASARKYGV
jgi:indolepyruvate ferredoxin oxidoreductase